MTPAFGALAVLAQRDNWERLGERFSGKEAQFSVSDGATVAAVILAALTFIVLLKVAERWQIRQAEKDNPLRLFRELCRAHRINRRDRQALQVASKLNELSQPAEIFLRPDILGEAAFAGDLVMASIRDRLFPGVRTDARRPPEQNHPAAADRDGVEHVADRE